jgi:hypothetical protein
MLKTRQSQASNLKPTARAHDTAPSHASPKSRLANHSKPCPNPTQQLAAQVKSIRPRPHSSPRCRGRCFMHPQPRQPRSHEAGPNHLATTQGPHPICTKVASCRFPQTASWLSQRKHYILSCYHSYTIAFASHRIFEKKSQSFISFRCSASTPRSDQAQYPKQPHPLYTNSPPQRTSCLPLPIPFTSTKTNISPSHQHSTHHQNEAQHRHLPHYPHPLHPHRPHRLRHLLLADAHGGGRNGVECERYDGGINATKESDEMKEHVVWKRRLMRL